MVAFGSLLVSDIPPVIDFGWMMTIGIMVAFFMTFTFFPCAALILNPGKPIRQRDWVHAMTRFVARVVERYDNLTLFLCVLITVIAIVGISRLSVENRFIDYFKPSTEIYQGMTLIDRKLGGTTPLDVILDAPQDFQATQEPSIDDPFGDQFGFGNTSGGITASSY